MRAVVIHAPKDLRVDHCVEPAAAPGAGQVRVRIEAGGICGSDLHYYHHGGFGTVRVREPMILGHEVAGTIEELGPGVAGLAVGDRVALNPSRPCGMCEYCRRGTPVHCLDMRFYGSAMRMPHIQGGFCDELIADAAQCHVVPRELPANIAAMAEPLAVCLHAAGRAGSLLGKRVLVTGAGPIGVLAAMVARRAGATLVAATDIAARPLEIVRCAADHAIDVAADPDALAPYCAGKGTFDVMFEASGAEGVLVGALAALRPGATVVQLGLGADVDMPMNTIVAKELNLKGTFRFHEEFATAVALLSQGLLDVTPLLTATLPVDDAVAAFDLASDRTRAMKVHLSFVS